ncbi:ATP-binding protein [Arthrobacter sp. MYb211]|uniref:ATP-binding protein n=1 Tax=unclassified Arthrobacter TaxID=235627 RepID=UPI000CFBB8D2|nr:MULTISPECIES: ATP-binding protein [unclassified Arthrobacter]PRA08161.1 ATP-binding protein [Arthrobacter sp. MYb221]PRC01649.1 ATP-binding protein [Arthrobacter sp. MYb211]
MNEQHLTEQDMDLFTALRMTAFGKAAISVANDPGFDEWTFSQKIRYALEQENEARNERRTQRLLKASGTPNLGACVEDIHYLPDRSLTREVVGRLASCQWVQDPTNVVILGQSSVGKTYLAQALLNAGCRQGFTARYFRLDDLANHLSVFHRTDPERLRFLQKLHDYEISLLDDFLTTPISSHIAGELLNILSAREHRGSTIITSQFDPEDWYRSSHDAVIAESILNRLVSKSVMIQLDGPNIRALDIGRKLMSRR